MSAAPPIQRLVEIVDAERPEAGDQVLYSVTSVLSVLDRPALIPWAVNETAKWVVKLHSRIPRVIEEDGEEEAQKWIAGLRWRTDGLLTAADVGTVSHSLMEQYVVTGKRPKITPDLHPSPGRGLHPEDVATLQRILDQGDRFLQEFQPRYEAAEVVVASPSYGYAGTCDGILSIDGQRLIIDYKTSRETYTKKGALKGPYPEVGLQLAAYRYAEVAAVWRARRTKMSGRRYYLLSREEREAAMPMPEVDGGLAIYLTPERYGVYPVRCGPDEFEAFLFCLEVARWQFNFANQMVGNPMTPPHPLSEADDDDPFKGLP